MSLGLGAALTGLVFPRRPERGNWALNKLTLGVFSKGRVIAVENLPMFLCWSSSTSGKDSTKCLLALHA